MSPLLFNADDKSRLWQAMSEMRRHMFRIVAYERSGRSGIAGFVGTK